VADRAAEHVRARQLPLDDLPAGEAAGPGADRRDGPGRADAAVRRELPQPGVRRPVRDGRGAAGARARARDGAERAGPVRGATARPERVAPDVGRWWQPDRGRVPAPRTAGRGSSPPRATTLRA